MKIRSILRRLSAGLLAALTLTCSLASCGKNDTIKETRVIGTVDGKDVCYDELYFLVNGYMDSVKESCGGDTEQMKAELDRLFGENVTRTYAMIRLGENLGLTYKESDFKDQINATVDSYISDSFGGDEEAFYADMKANGLTERYMRYMIGTEAFYNQLLITYPEQGLVSGSEEELLRIFEEKFIHVYHIAIFNDSGDDIEANYAKITEAHDKLKSGEASMYDLIKRGYSEDLSDPAAHGEYILRGTMDEAYEDAAFALEIGEISDVIRARGENNQGEYVECYYVIQRFAQDETYLNTYFYDLQDAYYGSVIAEDLEKVEGSLQFIPNEFYNSLDLTALTFPAETSYTGWIILCVVGGVVLLTAAIVIPIVILKKKYRKKNIAALQSARKKGEKA